MKTKTTPRNTNADGLTQWLSTPEADAYFGASFVLRFAVLTQVATGKGSLAAVAKKHGATRQAAHQHAVAARRIFAFPSSAP